VPTVAISGCAHTQQKPGGQCKCMFPVGSRRCPECGWNPSLAAVVEAPALAFRRSTAGSKPAQAYRRGVGVRPNTNRSRAVGWRHERAAKGTRQNSRWKYARQCFGEASEGLPISFRLLPLPFGHDRLRNPAWCHWAAKHSSPTQPLLGALGTFFERSRLMKARSARPFAVSPGFRLWSKMTK
jgi:hypothetical protein